VLHMLGWKTDGGGGAMIETTDRWIEALARASAIAGGVVLVFLSIMTGISIFGRGLLWAGLRPVPGDFELIEAGIAFAVCAFLPWTQLRKGHASVSLLTDRLGDRANAAIALLTDMLLLTAAAFMTWRHFYGLLDKRNYGETTFILNYPLWWAYAGCLFGLAAWVIVAVWSVAASADALRHGRVRGPEEGAIH